MTNPRVWASPGSGVPASGDSAPTAGEPPAAPPGEQPTDRPEEDLEAEFEAEIPLRPLGVSEILDGAITYIRRNPRATLGMSAIPTTIVQVIVTAAQYFILGGQARTDVTPSVVARSLGPAFVTFLGGLVLTAFVVLLLAGLLAPVLGRTLLGRGTSFGRAWREARPSAGRLVGAAAVIIAAVLLALALPMAPLALTIVFGAPAAAQAVAAVLGAPLAAGLMITCYVWFALTTPILVLERRGIRAALRRSAEIVRGRWWRMFGALALALFITFVVEFLALPVPFAVAQQVLLAADHEPGGWLLVAIVAVGGVGRILAGTLVNPFNAGVIALMYADRRMRREAFDLELQTRPPADPATAWLPGPLTEAGSGPQPKTPRPHFVMAPPTAPPAYPPPAYPAHPVPPGPPQGPPPGWRP